MSAAPVEVLVHEFKIMYNIGKATAPPIAITTALCHGLLAYHKKDSTRLVAGAVSPLLLHVLAAACVVCIVPFTLLYMDPTVNNKLLHLGAQVERGVRPKELMTEEGSIRHALLRWRGLNLIRALAVAGGALFGMLAVFSRP